MAVLRVSHVSLRAIDLERSVAFFEHVFGAKRLATPNFGFPTAWLQLGVSQIHLFQRGEGWDREAHFAFEVDEFGAIYRRAKALRCFDDSRGYHLFEISNHEVQLYLRDPSRNLIEVDWPDVRTLPDDVRAEVRQRFTNLKQDGEAAAGTLFTGEGSAYQSGKS
jgi:catechol 2,3-dioxygenase-like lactoylglutathione lyase family enzyme